MDEQMNQEQQEAPQAPQATPEAPKSNDVKDNKWWALLSYFGVLCLIPLLAKKESPFAQFHAKQGLVLLIGWVLTWLPFGFVFGVLAFVLSIIGIINVLSEKTEKLPLVGDLADQIKI